MRMIDADAALKALRKCQTYLYDARDPELKIELSSAEAAINNLPTIQPVATDTNAGDTISRQAAIDAFEDTTFTKNEIRRRLSDLPPAQPESLTDKEQRIFLAAMAREEKVCKQVDEECRDCREPYDDSLVRTCHEIKRKVKGALWT